MRSLSGEYRRCSEHRCEKVVHLYKGSKEMDINQLVSLLVRNVNHHVAGKRSAHSYDVVQMAQILAAFDSAKYLTDKMLVAENVGSDLDLLQRAIGLRSFDGMVLEFGVASGRTINHMASLTAETIYGFDSFAGLPEAWRTGFQQGAFAQQIPKVRDNVELIVGLFSETIPKFLKTVNGRKISLLHIDCDLYSSTKMVFEFLAPLIVPGTVIIFDEYFNYPGWRYHEFAAFQEFISERGLAYRYDSFVSKHQQVCVIIESYR